LYFSYSVFKQTAIGILKFDDVTEIKHTEIKIAHVGIEYLKFTLGGAD